MLRTSEGVRGSASSVLGSVVNVVLLFWLWRAESIGELEEKARDGPWVVVEGERVGAMRLL